MIPKKKISNKQAASKNKPAKKIISANKAPVMTQKTKNPLPQKTESQIENESATPSVTNKRADGTFARPLRELLMIQISRVIDERGWTQKQAADFLGVTQPRISDLSRVRVDNFTIDLLVDWLGALGRQVTIEAKAANSIIQHLSQRFVANEDAVPFYTKAITLDPLCTDNYIKRGDAYFAQNKYDLAVGDFTRAMELAPNQPELRLRRADCYVKLGQYRAAIFDCDKVLSQVESAETWPESFYCAVSANETATEHAMIEITWWAYLCKGRALESLDENTDALTAYTCSINAAPNFGQSYYARGCLFEKLNRTDEAVKDFETACLFDASDVPSSEKLAALRRKLELENSPDTDDEVAKLTQELNQASTGARKSYFYRKRAEVYQQRQNHAMAIADFTRALELDPTQNWLLGNIAYARYMTGDYKGTITDCDIIIARNFDPSFRSGAFMYRGWALERLNRLPSALESYNNGLRCNPNDVSVLWARARLLEQMGKVNEALYDYRQAIEIGQLLPTVNKDYIEQVQRDLDRASESILIESSDEPYTPDPQYYYTDFDS